MQEKKYITVEGKQRLLIILRETMQFNTGQLDLLRPFIRDLKTMGDKRRDLGLEPSPIENDLVRIYEYHLLLGFISLDLICAYRVYLKAEENYEVRYAAKHLIVILNEGYKKIYNYVWTNPQGKLLTLDRNKSFWKKDIGKIAEEHVPQLKPEYEGLTDMLEVFCDPELKSMKIPRNMFVHYDDNPSVIYDTLCALDIEVLTKKVIPFLEILKLMMVFTTNLQLHYSKFISATTGKMFIEHFNILEEMKTAKADDIEAVNAIQAGQDNLLKMQRQYYASLKATSFDFQKA